MVLRFDTSSTAMLARSFWHPVKQGSFDLARQVAEERLAEDWLNDGAKGYLVGISKVRLCFNPQAASAIVGAVRAMKLSHGGTMWTSDARRLMEVVGERNDEVWLRLEPYLER
jgi:hypothetical protein